MNRQPLKQELHLIIEKKIWYLCKNWKTRTKITGYDDDDLAQELRLHAYKQWDKLINLDPKKNIEGYIATMLKFKLIDIWRKQQRSQDVYDHCLVSEVELYDDVDNTPTIDINGNIIPKI